MIEERNLRFLYPPMVVVTSSLLLFLMTPNYKDQISDPVKGLIKDLMELGDLATGILGIGFLLFIGHTVGLFTVQILSIWALIVDRWSKKKRGKSTYEFKFSEPIWEKINEENERAKAYNVDRDDLSAGITYDHEKINEETRRWISRRWNSFFISANCALAYGLTILIPFLLHIKPNWLWILINLGMLTLCFFHARTSYWQSIRIVQYNLDLEKKKS